MKRIFVIFLLLLALPACASFKDTWKENSASAPDGSTPDADMKFSIGAQEKTSSEERTDLLDSKGDGLMKDLSIGVSNQWKF